MNLPRAGQSQPKGRIRPAGRKMPRSALREGSAMHYLQNLYFKQFPEAHSQATLQAGCLLSDVRLI